jgi:drug/metabolite transporter (DMT)-like permease
MSLHQAGCGQYFGYDQCGYCCVYDSFPAPSKSGSTLETVIIGNLITAVVCSYWVIQEPPTAVSWLPLLYMGTIQIGLSFIMYCSAIRYLAALDAVLIQTIEPLLNPIWVVLVIGEAPGIWALTGGGIVLCAVTARNIYLNRRISKTVKC